MDINATVDVGDNITSMLERLAGQLGTTADKVFPWYVEQSVLQGWTTLIAIGAALVVFSIVFAISFPKAKFSYGQENKAMVVSIASGIAMSISVLAVFMEGLDAVRQIKNPNYYAMKMLTQDIGRLVRK